MNTGSLTWAVVGGAILAGVGAVFRDLLIGLASRRIEELKPANLLLLVRYRASLKHRLAEMPFLFREMRLSAKDDYVETLVSTADTRVEPMGSPFIDYRTPLIRFKEARRAILFGDGGFGKTTLFRHIILRILEGGTKARGFERRLVPVFVSLKTVRLSSEYPILDTIQASDSIFDGDRGYARLRRLAKRRRLAIFLDGFDELPYAGGLDHVLKELETLFGRHQPRSPTFFEASKDFYVFAQDCRVYLSSRREFFFHNPIVAPADVPKWLVRGLGDRRAELIERVFSKYAVASPFLGERLNHELFLQQLAECCDPHLEELSFSPLFLTVMCYVYVDAVKEPGCDGRAVFSGGAPDLIRQCIDLLLSDVDEYKARGLNDVQRQALINRRSAYPKEKYEFLKFFAAQLYESGSNVFSRESLIYWARQYYGGSATAVSATIRKGLDSADPTVNMVDQLIFSGLFVVVDSRGSDKRLYDFPHRRFRETLAVAYYDTEDGASKIIKQFDQLAYGELALVYVEQSRFTSHVLDGVLDKLRNGSYESRHGDFLLDALRRAKRELAERVAYDFFELMAVSPSAEAPSALLEFLPTHNVYVSHLVREIEVSARVGRADLVVRLMCLAAVDSGVLDEVVVSATRSAGPDSLRLIAHAPIPLSQDTKTEIIARLIESCSSRGDVERALFDIYGVYFRRGRPKDRKLIHRVITSKVGRLSELLIGRPGDEEWIISSIECVFGGIEMAAEKSPIFAAHGHRSIPPRICLYGV